jgi:hypothetical protein
MLFCRAKEKVKVVEPDYLGKDVIVKEIMQATVGTYGRVMETKVHFGKCIGRSANSIGILTKDKSEKWFDTNGLVGGTYKSDIELAEVAK